MPTAWSSAEPARRRLFLAALGLVGLVLAWVVYDNVTADRPAPAKSGRPQVAVLTPPPPQTTIAVPPGHEDGDGGLPPTPVRARQPLQLPPRYDKMPAPVVPDSDLRTAVDRSMSFLETFANGRWDDDADKKIRAITSFVPQASVDVVLAQYERTRPKVSTHEMVTFRVTGAQWWNLSDRQLTLLVTGDRQVSDDLGDRTEARGFVLTLVRAGSGWDVMSARDPAEGDAGMGTR